MKGIAHFISGVTVASFCPWAVEAAVNGNPVFFILGAVAGILPDTADFKFIRFFYPYRRYAAPHPDTLHPQPVADAVAAAISAAAGGTPERLQLSTVPAGCGDWRQYRFRIDAATGEVRAQTGPVVSTGQVPQPGTFPAHRPVAVATFSATVRLNYEPVYTVDIFEGPGFLFERNQAGEVEIEFLPWHRSGSHSLLIGALLAGLATLWTWKAGLVVFGAYAAHIVEDQLGCMGSNLFYPVTKKRTKGFCFMHSGDALPNFTVVWLCGVLIFWNLYAAVPDPIHHFSFIRLMTCAVIIPFSLFGIVRRILMRGAEAEEPPAEWQI